MLTGLKQHLAQLVEALHFFQEPADNRDFLRMLEWLQLIREEFERRFQLKKVIFIVD